MESAKKVEPCKLCKLIYFCPVKIRFDILWKSGLTNHKAIARVTVHQTKEILGDYCTIEGNN